MRLPKYISKESINVMLQSLDILRHLIIEKWIELDALPDDRDWCRSLRFYGLPIPWVYHLIESTTRLPVPERDAIYERYIKNTPIHQLNRKYFYKRRKSAVIHLVLMNDFSIVYGEEERR